MCRANCHLLLRLEHVYLDIGRLFAVIIRNLNMAIPDEINSLYDRMRQEALSELKHSRLPKT
jgi:hypothetical protein